MIPASFLVVAGILWYGWSVQAHLHWIMPNIGTSLLAAGIIIEFQCIQTYVIEAYSLYAASAMSAIAVLRALTGFAFPLFGPYLYSSLGYGWGDSILALLAMIIGCPLPILFWYSGAALRAKSPYAAG